VLLLMAAASAGYVCRVAITALAPGAMHEFALTQAQMGTVFSAFLVGYTVFQVPSGWLADRRSARHIFPVLCAGFTLLTVLTAIVAWHGFRVAMVVPQLWLIRVAFGVIAAPTYPTSGRTIALIIPAGLQARANSLVLASVGIGSALTPVLLAPISSRYGWRIALCVAASLSAIVCLLWLIFAPREHRGSSTCADPDGVAAMSTLTLSTPPLRSPSFWFLFSSYLL
jgi:MFS transporter, ACS family, glucarate transporter